MNKYLVIGLGSMGKRRIRCLMALGVKPENIYGMDARIDRCNEAKEKYGICIVNSEREVDFSSVEAVIVSLPPDKHSLGVDVAIKHNKPVFVEASVVLEDVENIKKNNVNNIFIAPSCTFIYHPMIKEIKKMVQSGKYGKVCNFSYHSGQYLPDWHPWESVNDFYVSNRETGGAREIVPYELTWITDIFGMPKEIKGYFRKTMDLQCEIEDSYAGSIDYGDMIGNILVDVVGRNAVRNLIINFEKAQIQWRCEKEQIEIYEADSNEWKYIMQPKMIHEEGYSANINENMYIEETECFLKGIKDEKQYANTIDRDIEVLRLLKQFEDSDGGF